MATKNKEMKFLAALLKGKTITRKQAKGNYSLGNPSATVDRIKKAGYNLVRFYTIKKVKTKSGVKIPIKTVKYSIDS